MLGARFVKAGSVEFDSSFGVNDGLDDGVVVFSQVSLWSVGKFFDEVGVAEEVEEAGASHLRVVFPVGGPDFVYICFSPASEPFWIVEVPFVAEVVDRADEIIPWVALGEVMDPVVISRKPVAFEAAADLDSVVGVIAGS